MFKQIRLAVALLITLVTADTFAQFPYRESFKNGAAPGITFGGAPAAFLTAAKGTAPNGGSIDPQGDGYLRLTNNSKDQKGYVISNVEFPSTNGLTVAFEYYIYGGTGADGISLFLFDATADPFVIGGFGGSLGYAQITTTNPISPGVSKGYLGIGIDEYGNFSNDGEGRQGGYPGQHPGSVTLRGKGDGAALTPDNYPFLTSVETNKLGFDMVTEGQARKPDSLSSGYRRAYIDLSPNPNGGYNITVKITRGGLKPVTTTVIDNYYYAQPAPPILKYGIASSTGNQTNFHEIRNVFIDVSDSTGLTKPVGAKDDVASCLGKPVVIDVTSNDTSKNIGGKILRNMIDLNPAVIGIQTSKTIAGKGTFVVGDDGLVVFTPATDFAGLVSTSYTVTDNYGKTSDPIMINVTYVSAPPQPAAGQDQLVNTQTTTGATVLDGSDPGTNTGRWTQVEGPAAASFSSFTIRNPTVTNLRGGTYKFRWTISAARGCDVFDEVLVSVNHNPVAINDTATTGLSTFIDIDVLANDIDPDDNGTLDKTSISLKSLPQRGTVVVDAATGSVRYWPNDGYSGFDSFTYTIKDNFGAESAPATVVIAVNVKPEGTSDIAWTTAEKPVSIPVLDNDKGKSGATVLKNTDPQNGYITVNSNGSITYIPAIGFSGKDRFAYILRNKEGLESGPVEVFVNVVPSGSRDYRTTTIGAAVEIPVKDNDISKAGTTILLNSTPLRGTAKVNAAGSVTYSPAAGFSGTDNFTYRLMTADGLQSDSIEVEVLVTGVPPIAPDLEVGGNEGQNVMIDVPRPQGSTVVITAQPTHGTITVDPASGTVKYTPNPGYVGSDNFSYVIRDKNGIESSPGRILVEVSRPAQLGLAKAVTSTIKNNDGSYTVQFVFTLVNYGDDIIKNLTLLDDLGLAFKGADIRVLRITGTGSLSVNKNYNGVADKNLLTLTSTLDPRWKETVSLEVLVSAGSENGSYVNIAYAQGQADNTGKQTQDVSTNGLSPDPFVPGDPSPAIPTPVALAKQSLFIPEGFSPNGDGINDVFVIENTGLKHINLEVFNRWGNRVFKSENYGNDWTGKCNTGIHIGEDLPVGTYYYIAIFDGNERKVGYITINR